jgi:predicted secreted Zn-dependent protease
MSQSDHAQLATMKTSLSLAFFLTAGLCFSADAASVSKTYSYFAIGGSTLEQIQDELDLRGRKPRRLS